MQTQFDQILLIGNGPIDLAQLWDVAHDWLAEEDAGARLAATRDELSADQTIVSRQNVSMSAIIATDGGARYAAQLGLPLYAVVGDFDSGGDRISARFHVHLPQQDDTDFEKALTTFSARRWLGLGFSGGRFDLAMAVLARLAAWRSDHRRPRLVSRSVAQLSEVEIVADDNARPRFLLLDSEQVMQVCCGTVELATQENLRIGVLPLSTVCFVSSSGLHWSLEELTLSPAALVSASNRATAERVVLEADSTAIYVTTAPAHWWRQWW